MDIKFIMHSIARDCVKAEENALIFKNTSKEFQSEVVAYKGVLYTMYLQEIPEEKLEIFPFEMWFEHLLAEAINERNWLFTHTKLHR